MSKPSGRQKQTIENKVEYGVYICVLLLVKLTPNRLIPFIGKGLGLLCYFAGIRRKVVEKNIEIAFSDELDLAERRKLIRKTYLNTGSLLLEVLLLKSIPSEKIDKYITIEGLESLKDALARDEPIIIAGNHMGHLELLSAGLSTLGTNFHLFVEQQRNSLIDDVLNSTREKFGVSTISRSKTASIEMIKILKKKGVLAMAGDLNVPADSLFVDFFGKKATVGRGISSFTVSQKAAHFFTWIVREDRLKHRGFITRVNYEISGDKQADCQRIAQLLSSELETKIRQNPDQYFWFNRRWKTRPAEETDEPLY